MNIAILASGSGSNAENIIRSFLGDSEINISCVVSDKKNAKVLERSRKYKVPSEHVEKESGESRVSHEKKILKVAKKHSADFVVLAGYMRLLSTEFLDCFYNAITRKYNVINIHPSMLPAYPGLDSYKRAFSDQVDSGVTVHFVDSKMDSGEIILQKQFCFSKSDSFMKYEGKGREIEMELYPRALRQIQRERLNYGRSKS